MCALGTGVQTCALPIFGIAPGASMDDQAALAERHRLAQQAQKAREAGVFFQIATRPALAATSSAGQGAGIATAGELPPTAEASRLNLDPERDQNNQQRKHDFLNEPVEIGMASCRDRVCPYV